jgi:PD-(D/E)XK nuclease family transposase
MLANLDNEVFFKKVFTDVEVFCAFVKDVLGITMNITKVETEKVLDSKVSAIKFRMDLFAEDTKNRTVVEIQKIDYDYTYDRFTHYFMGNMIDMQRSSKDYAFAKDVYIIVVVTSAYRISEKNGKPIKDDVLISDMNPRTLSGELRDMYNHKMVVLNTAHLKGDTPSDIKDWLDLIAESMKNPENPHINTSKPAIAKAAQLAEFDDISPEQLAEAKIEEMRKINIALLNNDKDIAVKKAQEDGEARGEARGEAKAKAEAEKIKIDTIKKALQRGRLSVEEIAEDFDVSIDYVRQIDSDNA